MLIGKRIMPVKMYLNWDSTPELLILNVNVSPTELPGRHPIPANTIRSDSHLVIVSGVPFKKTRQYTPKGKKSNRRVITYPSFIGDCSSFLSSYFK